jgi:hypothetical protein
LVGECSTRGARSVIIKIKERLDMNGHKKNTVSLQGKALKNSGTGVGGSQTKDLLREWISMFETRLGRL